MVSLPVCCTQWYMVSSVNTLVLAQTKEFLRDESSRTKEFLRDESSRTKEFLSSRCARPNKGTAEQRDGRTKGQPNKGTAEQRDGRTKGQVLIPLPSPPMLMRC